MIILNSGITIPQTEYGLYSKKLLKSFRLQNVGYWEKGQRSEGTKFRRRV